MISFESSHKCLFRESSPLSEETFRAATKFVSILSGEGGTNLFTPLQVVFEQKKIANFR